MYEEDIQLPVEVCCFKDSSRPLAGH